MMSNEPCCSSAKRRMFMISVVLAVGSCFLAITSSYGCYFVQVEGFVTEDSPYFVPTTTTSGVGLWSYEDITQDGFNCVMYSEDQIHNFMDTPWQLARAFGMVAIVSLGIAMLTIILALRFEFSKRGFQAIGALLVIGSVFQLLTFILYSSKATGNLLNGSFHAGSATSIASSFSALLCALAVFRWYNSSAMSKELGKDDGSKDTDTHESEVEAEEETDEQGIDLSHVEISNDHNSFESDGIIDENPTESDDDDSRQSLATYAVTVVSSKRDGKVSIKNITVHGDGTRTVDEKNIPCFTCGTHHQQYVCLWPEQGNADY